MGRKPHLPGGNAVATLHSAVENKANLEIAARRDVAAKVKALRPRGMKPEMRKEWARVATVLAHPDVDRLKPQYVDVILEYCRVCLRIQQYRDHFQGELNREIYNAAAAPAGQPARATRNGVQIKTHPFIPQLNEAWRQWARLVALLGLSPTDERNMAAGNGNTGDATERFFNK